MRKIFLGMLWVMAACSTNRSNLKEDPYVWLENSTDPKTIEWVKNQNQPTKDRLESDPRYKNIANEIREILTAKDKIPYVKIVGDRLLNFWQDQKNPRGIWRYTSLKHYRSKNPNWVTLLDMDALNAQEKKKLGL